MARPLRHDSVVRTRCTVEQRLRWTAAALAAGYPSLSDWLRALADAAAPGHHKSRSDAQPPRLGGAPATGR